MAKKKVEEKAKMKKLRDIPAESFLPTGIEALDKVIGGGFPRKRITQIWGVPGVGKSYILGRTLAELCKNGGKALYIDSEYALNQTRLAEMGVDLDAIDYMPTSKLEEVADYVIKNVKDYDLIVIDTLVKLTPTQFLDNDVSQNTIGLAARLIGKFEANLRPALFESNCAVVGINQARANLGYGQAESKAAGGYAWLHTVDLSLKIARKKNLTHHHISSVKVDKSRVSRPYQEVEIQVNYKEDK